MPEGDNPSGFFGVNMNINEYIEKRLFEMRDLKYRDFNSRLIPTVDKEKIIGVRTPQLRAFSKELVYRDDVSDFLNNLPHKYYEENNIHGFLIEMIMDYDECIKALNAFLPFVDNWATCDMMRPKIFKKNSQELISQINNWIISDDTYTVRFAIGILNSFYLDDNFKSEYLKAVSDVHSDEYYIKMMIAWFFATALTKQYKFALPYIENRVLDTWIHNKAIQKSCESFRISDDKKRYLKSLKIKASCR